MDYVKITKKEEKTDDSNNITTMDIDNITSTNMVHGIKRICVRNAHA